MFLSFGKRKKKEGEKESTSNEDSDVERYDSRLTESGVLVFLSLPLLASNSVPSFVNSCHGHVCYPRCLELRGTRGWRHFKQLPRRPSAVTRAREREKERDVSSLCGFLTLDESHKGSNCFGGSWKKGEVAEVALIPAVLNYFEDRFPSCIDRDVCNRRERFSVSRRTVGEPQLTDCVQEDEECSLGEKSDACRAGRDSVDRAIREE